MKFFSNFAWAVPLAFSDALATCLFEEGDVLYENQKAYKGNWSEAKKHFDHSLQVRYPARAGNKGKELIGGLFKNNWLEKVVFDVYDHRKGTRKEVETTQGRLYSFLWKGDRSVLEMNSDNPTVPLDFKEAKKQLSETRNKADAVRCFGYVFVMPRDLTNRITISKYVKVEKALSKYMSHEVLILNPEKAGLREPELYLPTVDIAFFPTSNIDRNELEKLLKKNLYTPTKGAKKELYSLDKHGAIF